VTCNVPKLHSESLAFEISDNFGTEITTDSRGSVGFEFIVTKTIQETGFANPGITNYDDFEEKSVLVHLFWVLFQKKF